MFESLSVLARQAERLGSRQAARFEKFQTSRGSYFVTWDPEPVNALITAEDLSAGDLEFDTPWERHRLIRELFLLGCRDEIGSDAESHITEFARQLLADGDQPPAG